MSKIGLLVVCGGCSRSVYVCVREKEMSEDRKVTQRDERGTSHKEERETSRGLMVFRDQLD